MGRKKEARWFMAVPGLFPHLGRALGAEPANGDFIPRWLESARHRDGRFGSVVEAIDVVSSPALIAIKVMMRLHVGAKARRFAVLVDLPHQTATDRKSTRLNSSHLGISYAVFCLK